MQTPRDAAIQSDPGRRQYTTTETEGKLENQQRRGAPSSTSQGEGCSERDSRPAGYQAGPRRYEHDFPTGGHQSRVGKSRNANSGP
ncbi:unnamed protein product [Macrosiphum euphorbiae]|uniref:Uncharacterized protein n=1 Tax=Macrosiphum euphorbiae TaxID=13131 RepID=A0AAV0XH03_9HEMI|nr:unnamed protein product [Macrosiphum euphorbiae]